MVARKNETTQATETVIVNDPPVPNEENFPEIVPTFGYISTDTDLTFGHARKVKHWGVEILKKSMLEEGFINGCPIELSQINGGYRLFEGRHRWEAAKAIGLKRVPVHIYEGLTEDQEIRLGKKANRLKGSLVPETWLDDARLVLDLTTAGRKQADIAGMIGCSQPRVSQLKKIMDKIDELALAVISKSVEGEIITAEQENRRTTKNGSVIENITAVIKSPFNEHMLEDILDNTPEQQRELVDGLVEGRLGKEKDFTVPKFKVRGQRNDGRNTMIAEAQKSLLGYPDVHLENVKAEINQDIQTVYDKEWIEQQKHTGEKFKRLVEAELYKYDKDRKIQVYEGDFREVMPTLSPESVDVILCDPPYPHEYVGLYGDLARLANFVLRPGGSLIVMCGQSYLPEIFALMTEHIRYYWTISYGTPGGTATTIWQRNRMNSFWKPVLWFVKGDYTGNSQSDIAASPTNGGQKDHDDWQQSEGGMVSLVEKFTQQGDVVLDPMMGTGTTGVAALKLKREFIGIDNNPEKIVIARQRLAQVREETEQEA